ncbi:restriction endonuclease subunit S [Candidatus Dojkabacteria bacterium]|nr:restriction endonuclease subunit S [Candidatus Dojkabacteria bacterium]
MEFKKIKISDLGKVITGRTPPTKNEDYYGNKYPFITPTDLKKSKRYIETERYLSELGFKHQEKVLLPPDSTCLVCIGATIGKICLTKEQSFTNQQINSIIPNTEKYDAKFIYYLLSTKGEEIKKIAGGAATPIVNKSSFSNFEIEIPNLDDQNSIASILSAFDDLIENNTRRIEILEEMARLIYREWFVHFRFPGHEDVKMVDSELGKIPEGWEVRKLEELCELILGQSPKSEFYNEEGEGLPFHQGVRDFGRRFPTTTTWCTKRKRIAEEGDILFSVRAPVGRINIANTKMVIGRGLHAIRSKADNQNFIYHQLKHKFREEDIMGGGTIFKSVTKKDMLNLQMLNPSQDIINLFEKKVSPISNQIRILTDQNTVLKEIRDLILPQLISAKIELI